MQLIGWIIATFVLLSQTHGRFDPRVRLGLALGCTIAAMLFATLLSLAGFFSCAAGAPYYVSLCTGH